MKTIGWLIGAAGLAALLYQATGGPVELEQGVTYDFVLETTPGIESAPKLALSAALQANGASEIRFDDSPGKTRIHYRLKSQERRQIKPGDVLLDLLGFQLRFVSARRVS